MRRNAGISESLSGAWHYGMVERVLADELRPAVESLERAARVTAEELRERFHRQKREEQ